MGTDLELMGESGGNGVGLAGCGKRDCVDNQTTTKLVFERSVQTADPCCKLAWAVSTSNPKP